MNPARASKMMLELAELDERRAVLQRAIAEALLEQPAPSTPARRRVAPAPEPGVEVDDLTRHRARRAMRRAGVAPR